MEVPKQPPEFDLIPHSRTRLAIGERVSRSRREIPHFDLFVQADVGSLLDDRERRKQSGDGFVPTYNDLFIYIVARVMPEFPVLNAWCEDEGLKVFKPVHLGFAVQTDQGVLLPTVFDANKKPLRQINEEALELTELARKGRLRASFQQWAGFTISNVGPKKIDAFDAIISPPQTGILAIGPIAKRPVVSDDTVVVRPTVWLALTVDHRVVDGAVGAEFLSVLMERIQSWSGEEE
ncbi:MAG: 2-oxo acid dehydrogenase subunit E2 [Armatimonadota bacterium]|nr:MAG: 2-oxo acid dehydrogenase subunit E2 [Armatimonadota bacterium]